MTVGGPILVTGATGYVGSALAARLAAAGVKLRTASRRHPGASLNAPHFSLPEMPGPADWRAATEGAGAVIHCAARAHVLRETEAAPLEAFRRVNTRMTLELARAAHEAGVRRFVFVSSIGVCGGETFGKPFDHDSPAHPHSLYAVAKSEAETGLRRLGDETGLEVVIVRPPLVYGPDAAGNFARLVRLVDKGLPLPFAGLANRRSLVGLENLVDFLRVCTAHPRAPEITHAVCDGPALSTAELVRAIARALDRPARLVPFPAFLLRKLLEAAGRGGMAQQLFGSLEIDSSASREMLSWSPPSSMADEMNRVAQAFRSPKVA
jgi:UDP-4-keto-D-QuiNAc 4-reductase